MSLAMGSPRVRHDSKSNKHNRTNAFTTFLLHGEQSSIREIVVETHSFISKKHGGPGFQVRHMGGSAGSELIGFC